MLLKQSDWKLIRLLPSLGLIIGALVFMSCDSTATIHLDLVYFNQVQLVGMTPVKQVEVPGLGPQWVPACNGDEERIRLDFVLQSTDRDTAESNCSKEDCDLQIRPGEDPINKNIIYLGSEGTLSEEHFELTAECLSEHSGGALAPISCTSIASQQVKQPSVSIQELGFTDHLDGQGRGTPVGVAILIDQSGSTSGIVDPNSCLEGKAGSFDTGDSISECQSDQKSLRLAAAKNLINQLNAEDSVIVFAFGEDETPNVRVVCDYPGVDEETNQFLLDNCYSSNKSYAIGAPPPPNAIVTESGPIDALQGKGSSRSNLWTAIDEVWEYMLAKKQVAKHLVILTDGPDTCRPESESYQHCFEVHNVEPTAGPQPQEPCGASKTFESTRSTIEQSVAGGTGDMHISFIHFQSRAYDDIDPRMQQISCLTSGHYQFLNFNLIPSEGSDRKKALNNATNRIRYTFGGFWTLRTDISSLTEDPDTSDAIVNKGSTYSLKGSLTLKASPLKQADTLTHFGTGNANLDERLHYTRSCVVDADCGTGAGVDCATRCSPETGTCIPAAQGSSCEGGTGTCCVGSCVLNTSFCQAQNPDPPQNLSHSLCP